MTHASPTCLLPRPARGAAALIVVMLLFFVISMVAAYASRNLIFEQKTSANQYRGTQAFEAAEAGVEWAAAMLNGGRVDAACVASNDVANNTFRARYLSFDAAGSITPRTWVSGGATVPLRPSCVRTDASWSCSCPSAADPVLVAPMGAANYPAFRVRFDAVGQPGVVRIVSTGCTRLDNACLGSGWGTAGEGAAMVSVVLALASALPTPPPAALTVRGDLNVGPAALRVQNTDVDTHGLTANTGGVINAPSAQWVTVAGSPGERSFISNDPTLAGLDGAQLFTTLFRVGKTAYMNLPGTVRLNDCAAACSQKLADAVQAHPGHVIWVDGDVRIEANLALGSAAEPVVVVATGNVSLEAASIQIFGLLYSQAANWNNAGLGAVTVRGAAVAEGHFVGNGLPAFEYDPAILKTLQVASGALVRVPGSWRDWN